MEIRTDTAARYLSFVATQDYKDGDSWTINGAPVTATYANGDPLLPTAVLAGDVVVGVLEGSVLRLLMDKPTPQPNMLINGDFTDPINQRGETVYATGNATKGAIDGWVILAAPGSSGSLAIVEGGVELVSGKEGQYCNLEQRKLKITAPGTYTFAVEAGNVAGIGIQSLNIKIDQQWARVNLVDGTAILTTDIPNPREIILAFQNTNARPVLIKRIKLEPGNRFTGWDHKSFEERLAECQPYGFLMPGINRTRASQKTSTNLDFQVACPQPLRRPPTLPKLNLYTYPDNKLVEGFTFEAKSVSGGVVIVRATKANHGVDDAFICPAQDMAFIDAGNY